MGTAVKGQVSSIGRLPSAYLAPETAASLSAAASDSHATSVGGTRQTDLPTAEGTQTEQVAVADQLSSNHPKQQEEGIDEFDKQYVYNRSSSTSGTTDNDKQQLLLVGSSKR